MRKFLITLGIVAGLIALSSLLFEGGFAGSHISSGLKTFIPADSTVDSTKICDYAVKARHIDTSAIEGYAIKSGEITASHLGASAVGAFQIAEDSVGASAIGPSAIDSTHVGNGKIGTEDLADGSVWLPKLAGDIDSTAIANDGIGTEDLPASVIWTGQIANDAVTLAKLAPNAVDSSSVVDHSLSAADFKVFDGETLYFHRGALKFYRADTLPSAGATNYNAAYIAMADSTGYSMYFITEDDAKSLCMIRMNTQPSSQAIQPIYMKIEGTGNTGLTQFITGTGGWTYGININVADPDNPDSITALYIDGASGGFNGLYGNRGRHYFHNDTLRVGTSCPFFNVSPYTVLQDGVTAGVNCTVADGDTCLITTTAVGADSATTIITITPFAADTGMPTTGPLGYDQVWANKGFRVCATGDEAAARWFSWRVERVE